MGQQELYIYYPPLPLNCLKPCPPPTIILIPPASRWSYCSYFVLPEISPSPLCKWFQYVAHAAFLRLWLTGCHSLPLLLPDLLSVWYFSGVLHKTGLSTPVCTRILNNHLNCDLQTLESLWHACNAKRFFFFFLRFH